MSSLEASREAELVPEQIGDLETLVRSLGQRERLRPLLDQVLDALVLWTGVERGLLLLRAREAGSCRAPRVTSGAATSAVRS